VPAAQEEGVQFLFRQWAQGQGGVLADDMGELVPRALPPEP